VLGGRSHGELFFHPWVLPPFVSPCPASCCLASRSTLHHRCCCKLNGSSRLEACCKLNGATSQRNTTRKVQIGSKHFQFTAKLASYWNHHQSFKTSRTTNLYAYTRSFICSSFTLRLSRKAIKHMRKAFIHSVRRSSPNASRTGVFYWPLKINFWIYESAVYICCSFKCETYGCSHFIVVSLYDTSSSPHEIYCWAIWRPAASSRCLYIRSTAVPTRWTEYYLYDGKVNCSASSVWNGYGLQSFLCWSSGKKFPAQAHN